MKKVNAFTLIELLIAIAISGFIIISMIQSINNVQKLLAGTRVSLQFNKSVCLFFNQIERDFNTAIIPELAEDLTQTLTVAKAVVGKEDTSVNKDKEKEILFFKGESYGEETRKKIGDKRYELFRYANFVNTNPLQVWGQKRVRLVRIMYELILNKEKSKKYNKDIYDLFRSETLDLKNAKFKGTEEITTQKRKDYFEIRKHLVAANVKEMYLEFAKPEEKNQKKEFETEESTVDKTMVDREKFIKTFAWGIEEKTKNILPQQVELFITFWDEYSELEETFQCTIPIIAYPYQKPKKTEPTKISEDKPKEESGKKSEETKKPPPKPSAGLRR